MTEPTAYRVTHGASPAVYCGNCDLLVGLDGLHILKVVATGDGLLVRVESSPGAMGCPACGGWRRSVTAGARLS